MTDHQPLTPEELDAIRERLVILEATAKIFAEVVETEEAIHAFHRLDLGRCIATVEYAWQTNQTLAKELQDVSALLQEGADTMADCRRQLEQAWQREQHLLDLLREARGDVEEIHSYGRDRTALLQAIDTVLPRKGGAPDA